MHVRQSAPVDSGDPGIKPEGWLVDIANKNVDPGYFRIAMICAKGKYKYLTRAFNVPPQDAEGGRAQVPGRDARGKRRGEVRRAAGRRC